MGLRATAGGLVVTAGVSTFVGFSTFKNDIYVAGVSTFAAISATTGSFSDDARFDGDIQAADTIVHTGDTNTKIRFPAADTVTVETAGSERLRVDSNGNIGVGNDASFPIYTDSGDRTLILGSGSDDAAIQLHSGTDKFGGLYFGDATSGGARYQGYVEYKHDDDYLRFATGGAEKLRITSAGLVGINQDTPTAPLHVKGTDNNTTLLVECTDADANVGPIIELFRNSASPADNDALGRIDFRGDDDAGNASTFARIAVTALDVSNNSEDARLDFIAATNDTFTPTMSITGEKVGIGTDTPVGNLEIRDSSKANLIVAKDGLTVKNNSDLASNYDIIQIGAGGALASYNVETATASTYLIHNAYRDTGNNWKYRYADTAARIRVNSPARTWIFESAASGSADGDITFSEQLRITSAGNLALGNDGSFPIYTDTNDRNFILGTGSDDAAIQIHSGSDKYGGVYFGDATSGGDRYRGYIEFKHGTNDDYLRLATGGTERIRLDKDGHLTPAAAGTQNLGSTSKEFNNLYLGDGGSAYFGNDQDFQIYHHSGGNSYIKETGGGALVINADDFYLQNVATTTYLRTHSSGQIDLTHSGNTKLSTSSTGVTVTGEVASTQDYPTQRPTLDFNFIRTKTLDSIFTYQRLGAASFVNEQGLVELVGDNTPRFDHDPVTRECKGLLLEEGRSNLIYPSSDWSGDYWTINNSGSLSRDTHNGDTKDPAGTYTATKLVTLASNTNTKDIWWTKSNITYTNGSKYAVSCFAKSTTGLHLQLRPRGQSSNRAWATYNLTTGVVGNSGGTTLVSTKIEKYPNGWYRCSLVFTGSGNSSCSLGTLIMDDGNDAEAVSHTGDASKSIYLWGAQIELSNTVTSYIPTAFHAYDLTAIKTRGKDDLRIHGTDFTDFYNPLESTICMSFTHLDTSANIGTNARVYRFRSSNTSSDTRIDYLSHPYYHPFISEDGNQPTGGSGLDAGTLLYEGQVNKTAVKVKENDFGSCLNGGSVAVDTNGDWNPTNAFDEVSLGSSNGASTTLLMGHMQRFTYYPVALPDNQLKTLTS